MILYGTAIYIVLLDAILPLTGPVYGFHLNDGRRAGNQGRRHDKAFLFRTSGVVILVPISVALLLLLPLLSNTVVCIDINIYIKSKNGNQRRVLYPVQAQQGKLGSDRNGWQRPAGGTALQWRLYRQENGLACSFSHSIYFFTPYGNLLYCMSCELERGRRLEERKLDWRRFLVAPRPHLDEYRLTPHRYPISFFLRLLFLHFSYVIEFRTISFLFSRNIIKCSCTIVF